MHFIPGITNPQLALMIAATASTALAAVATLMRTMPLRRHYKRTIKSPKESPENPMGAAIIIFARDEYDSLAEMLPQVLAQDYDAPYEVIVVNDGDSTAVRDVVESLMTTHTNLYFTAAPDGARNLSRKKLALTLGIKAAKSPVVVHTTASARINSDQWLRSIMRHFEPGGNIDIVIGYAAAPKTDDHSFGALIRAFDSALHDLGWISPASAGHPWRGIEHNLAYRRDIFFLNKGFSRHLNLRDGDDDIFVSDIAQGFNTVAEISDDALVEVPGANNRRAFNERIASHRFTKKFISNRPRICGTIATLAYFLAPFPLVASAIIGPLDVVGWVYFGAIGALWYAIGLLWNPAIKILHSRRAYVLTPFMAFTRPLRIGWRTFKSIFTRNKRYTWE